MKYFEHFLAVLFLVILSFFAYQYQRSVLIYEIETKIYELQTAQEELEFNHNNCLRQRYDNGEDADICYRVLFKNNI